jgi:TrpR-related protein YerC/YecD
MNENNELCEMKLQLYKALLTLKNTDEIERFLKDLCTPQEIQVLAERWRVCKLLHQGNLSYREINSVTGASLATIGRVARFLNNEPHHGYELVLKRIKSPSSLTASSSFTKKVKQKVGKSNDQK